MDDLEWNDLVAGLTEHAPELIAHIPRHSVEEALAQSPQHPLSRLFLEPTTHSSRLSAHSIAKVARWLRSPLGVTSRPWWARQLKLLPGESSASALAEIRALGAMLPNDGSISGGVKISAFSADGRAPDFRIECDEEVFVEVCCARMNEDEKARVEWVHSVEDETRVAARDAAIGALGVELASTSGATATARRPATAHRLTVSASAMRAPNGGHVVLQISEQVRRPYGDPGSDGDAQTLARRLAGKKLPGQVPEGKAGILWMDLSDPDWDVGVDDTLPFNVFNKGLNLANTYGVWHSFYGRKGITPFMERHAIGFDFGGARRSLQLFDGRFHHAEQRCWSAAVLRCADGVVIFEHPSPLIPLPMGVLRELTDISGYAPYASVHRFDSDPKAVSRRLDHTEQMLTQKMLDAEVVSEGYRKLPKLLQRAKKADAAEDLREVLREVVDVVEWAQDAESDRKGEARIRLFELPRGFWSTDAGPESFRPSEPPLSGSLGRQQWLRVVRAVPTVL